MRVFKPLILLLLLISTISIKAQKVNKFGIKVGSNFNDWYFTFDPLGYTRDFYKMKVGFDVGAVLSQTINNKISLHEELYFGLKSAKGIGDGSAHPSFNAKVIAIPLTLSYLVYKELGVDIGGEYARLIHSKSQYYALENKNYFTVIGGFRYKLSPKVSIYSHYNFNFSNIFHIKYTDAFGSPIGPTNIKNYSLSLNFLYNFEKSK
jgi:Outer membrane protein beta-barrel domain